MSGSGNPGRTLAVAGFAVPDIQTHPGNHKRASVAAIMMVRRRPGARLANITLSGVIAIAVAAVWSRA